MKNFINKIVTLTTAALLLTACTQQQGERVVSLVVSNPTQLDAMGVVDGISLKAVCDSLGVEADTPLTLLDENGQVVCTQLFNNGQEDLLLFESHTLADGESSYTVKVGAPDTTFAPSVFVKHYPRRKDDLTWENESSIWRAYGPELKATDERAYGYDIWCKNTTRLVTEERYQKFFRGWEMADSLNALELHAQADSTVRAMTFHENHGDGLDAYSVGQTLGGGTAAIVADGRVAYPWSWRSHEILADGPLLAAFRLNYDTTYVAGDTLVEHRTIVTQKGTRFNIVSVSYEGLTRPQTITAGIAFHGEPDSVRLSTTGKYICYSDPSDRHESSEGRVLVGIYSPTLTQTSLELGHLMAYSQYNPGDTFTYYMGSGWSRGDCPSLDAMEQELKQMSDAPRTVRIVVKR